MKTSRIQITVTEFANGHILLGYSEGLYFVKTRDGIIRYTHNEMKEIYNYKG